MAKVLYLRPVNGARVLDPATEPPTALPVEGRKVEDTPYWRRRLRAKEVEEVKSPVAASAPEKGK